MVVSVYPDHGESFYLDSETYSFRVNAHRYDLFEIQDEIDIGINDEVLAFSLDWDNVLATDIKLVKLPDGSFSTLDTSLFNNPGLYYFCWKAPFIDYEGYIIASDSFWYVKDNHQISLRNDAFKFNQKLEKFILVNPAGENDEFSLFSDSPDWDISNMLDQLKISDDRYYLIIWLPESS